MCLEQRARRVVVCTTLSISRPSLFASQNGLRSLSVVVERFGAAGNESNRISGPSHHILSWLRDTEEEDDRKRLKIQEEIHY